MPTVFITGASRGIGKAIAVRLARAGFDVAIAARTVHEGEELERSQKSSESNVSAQPGSLESTKVLVEAEGVRAMAVPVDVTVRQSAIEGVDTVLKEWGQIDILINNATYRGPGSRDVLAEIPLELMDVHFQSNVMTPLALTQHLLPHWLERGSGSVLNVVSGAALMDPTVPMGEGGWSIGYGMTKGALIRMAGFIAVELGDRGIRAYNIQPGNIATERSGLEGKEDPYRDRRAPPDVVGAAIAWLLTDPSAADPNGRTIDCQGLCRERGLLPGWP